MTRARKDSLTANPPRPGELIRPPRPKLADNPTAEQLQSYVRALYGQAKAISREEPIHVWKKRLKGPLRGNGIRNVLAVRHLTSLAFSEGVNLKRCKKCRRVAVKGTEVCYFHGGAAVVAKRNLAKGIPPIMTPKAVGQATSILYRARVLPAELTSDPLIRQLATRRFRANGHILQQEAILAWFARQDGDWEPWTRLIAKARTMGFLP